MFIVVLSSTTSIKSVVADAPPAVFKDGAGSIYIHSGVKAGDRLDIELTGQPFQKNLRAGACGQLIFGPTTTLPTIGNSIVVNGITINLNNISTSSPVPKCTNGKFSRNISSFKSKGKVTLIGYTPGQSYPVIFNDISNHFSITVNGCAFATIKSTAKHPLTTQITINRTTYNIPSLITAEPPVCRKNGANVSLYTPASW